MTSPGGGSRVSRKWPVLVLVVMAVAGLTSTILSESGELRVADLLWLAAMVELTTVGAVLAYRVPRNSIGWIMLGVVSVVGVSTILQVFSALGWEHAATLNEWTGHWIWIPIVFTPTVFVLLLFPDGRVVSRKWSWLPWTAAVGIAAFSFSTAFGEFMGGDPQYGRNPYFLDTPVGLVDGLGWLGFLCLAGALTGGTISMVIRFRRSSGVEKLQLKWPTYASAISAVGVLGAFLLGALIAPSTTTILDALVVMGLAMIPIAIAIALLRYRLYEIDRLINRTLVYVVVTLGLAGIYALVALLLPQLLPLRLDNDLSVAAATLVVAGLFRPLTHRVQAEVDRRFFRLRYNAQKTLEGLAVRLQNQTDVSALREELIRLTDITVQPSRVGVWLSGTERAGRQTVA